MARRIQKEFKKSQTKTTKVLVQKCKGCGKEYFYYYLYKGKCVKCIWKK